MNRNNIFIHVALALVLILVAAFAGQLNRWRKEWKSQVRIVHTGEKTKPTEYPDAWTESARRVSVPPRENDDEE